MDKPKLNRITVTACCGRMNHVIHTYKAIRRHQVEVFRSAGWLIPKSHLEAGIFFVKNKFVTATAAYGSTAIKVNCRGSNCDTELKKFEELLIQAIES